MSTASYYTYCKIRYIFAVMRYIAVIHQIQLLKVLIDILFITEYGYKK